MLGASEQHRRAVGGDSLPAAPAKDVSLSVPSRPGSYLGGQAKRRLPLIQEVAATAAAQVNEVTLEFELALKDPSEQLGLALQWAEHLPRDLRWDGSDRDSRPGQLAGSHPDRPSAIRLCQPSSLLKVAAFKKDHPARGGRRRGDTRRQQRHCRPPISSALCAANRAHLDGLWPATVVALREPRAGSCGIGRSPLGCPQARGRGDDECRCSRRCASECPTLARREQDFVVRWRTQTAYGRKR